MCPRIECGWVLLGVDSLILALALSGNLDGPNPGFQWTVPKDVQIWRVGEGHALLNGGLQLITSRSGILMISDLFLRIEICRAFVVFRIPTIRRATYSHRTLPAKCDYEQQKIRQKSESIARRT
jgi:hypothetical protein